jgi:hypothetical protein
MNRSLLSDVSNDMAAALGFALWLICIVSVSWLGIRVIGASGRQRRRSKSRICKLDKMKKRAEIIPTTLK